MSVAFRRESDEEHLEPKFEIPIAPGPNLVTRRGLALIEAKVAELESAVAAADDDTARKAAQRELRYWNTRHATAQLAPAAAQGEAGIGSQVEMRLGGTTRTITIVGGDEADPASGRIGFQAPLARAVLGGSVGETLDFNGVVDAIEIVAIEPVSVEGAD